MFSFNKLRGSTLIEVLIAGALLAIGMTAIAAMLNESVFSSRMALRKTEASEVGISQLERLSSMGYSALTPGIFDGGLYTDDAGTLLYQTIYQVDAGGVPANAYYVSVQVTYWDNLRNPRTQTYATVVSQP
jgi:Tfp pilus assembly protein PilV